MMRSGIMLGLYLLLVSPLVLGGEILEELPDSIDPEAVYVFYSHGRILEGNIKRPVHPKWGVYDFPAVVETLAADNDWFVLAKHRGKSTDIGAYSDYLVRQVRFLIGKGVDPRRITLAGFSKGGIITAMAAHKLTGSGINTVLLASCFGSKGGLSDVQISNELLSVFESTDSAGSCDFLVDGKHHHFQELRIATGKGHGAFYLPDSVWVNPVKEWIEARSQLNHE